MTVSHNRGMERSVALYNKLRESAGAQEADALVSLYPTVQPVVLQ
jgi:hypothetical protein